jgi:hypothetical protein
MILRNKFSFTVIVLVSVSLTVIYLLFINGLVTLENHIILKHTLSITFIVSFILTGLSAAKIKSVKELFSPYKLLIISLVLLLVFSLNIDLGSWATGLFALCSLIYLIKNKTWHPINKIYYVVFAYALLKIFGTIGTIKGFRIPDRTLSFFVLPLAFSCFSLKKETCLKILKVFFRGMVIYMAITVVSWLYYKLLFNVDTIDWFTKKLAFFYDIAIYDWVLNWAYFFHPSYVALVLLAGMIAGFYLYYKKSPDAEISRFELGLFLIGYFLTIMILESRIGFVCGFFVLAATGLFYLYLKKNYFKIAFALCILLTIPAVYMTDDLIAGFVSDNIRKTDYTLAVNYVKDHLMWGTGHNEQYIALETQAEKMKDVLPLIDNKKSHAHNQFLGEMVQFGIWGLIVLVALLITLFYYAFKMKSYPFLIFLSICFIYMLIEEPLTGQSGITRTMVFLTFFVHLIEANPLHKKMAQQGLCNKKSCRIFGRSH